MKYKIKKLGRIFNAEVKEDMNDISAFKNSLMKFSDDARFFETASQYEIFYGPLSGGDNVQQFLTMSTRTYKYAAEIELELVDNEEPIILNAKHPLSGYDEFFLKKVMEKDRDNFEIDHIPDAGEMVKDHIPDISKTMPELANEFVSSLDKKSQYKTVKYKNPKKCNCDEVKQSVYGLYKDGQINQALICIYCKDRGFTHEGVVIDE